MWKKEETKSQAAPEISTVSEISTSSVPPVSKPLSQPIATAPIVSSRATACISQGITIKGEVTGSEDLFVDGIVQGQLNLANGSLTIGPNADVKADVSAREVIVRGRVDGKISARERVQLWSTARVAGEVSTARLAIEEGAVLRGKAESGKPEQKKAEGQVISKPLSDKVSNLGSMAAGAPAN